MLDIDCLTYSLSDLKIAYNWVDENESLIGNDQNISHIISKNRIFAAASLLMLHKKSWIKLVKPDLPYSMNGSDEILIDATQNISLAADDVGYQYRVYCP